LPKLVNQVVQDVDLIRHAVWAFYVFTSFIERFNLALSSDVLQLQVLVFVCEERVFKQ
jgi:hypothetical protein